jgi:hypothetical protein
MESLYLASERHAFVESLSVGAGRNGTEGNVIPAGLCHAYAWGEDETLCGEPLDALMTWPDLAFRIDAMSHESCLACVNRAREV